MALTATRSAWRPWWIDHNEVGNGGCNGSQALRTACWPLTLPVKPEIKDQSPLRFINPSHLLLFLPNPPPNLLINILVGLWTALLGSDHAQRRSLRLLNFSSFPYIFTPLHPLSISFLRLHSWVSLPRFPSTSCHPPLHPFSLHSRPLPPLCLSQLVNGPITSSLLSSTTSITLLTFQHLNPPLPHSASIYFSLASTASPVSCHRCWILSPMWHCRLLASQFFPPPNSCIWKCVFQLVKHSLVHFMKDKPGVIVSFY